MNFDVYLPFKDKEGKIKPGIKANPMSWDQIRSLISSENVKNTVDGCRAGHKELKTTLPAACWTGRSKTGKRLASDMEPTQFVMIDIDHAKDPSVVLPELMNRITQHPVLTHSVALVYLTPSLGVRIVFRATEQYPTLIQHMEWARQELRLDDFGDFDSKVCDMSRLSFLTYIDDVRYLNASVLTGEVEFDVNPIQVSRYSEAAHDESQKPQESAFVGFSKEEEEKFKNLDFRGTPVKLIVEKYVEVMGKPSSGEVHNYYNEMVKNFRCITSNDKRALLYLLPRFDHTEEECWSQIVSITRVNTLSRLPKEFYYFLKNNGFYKSRSQYEQMEEETQAEEYEPNAERPPYLPPVFKELVGTAPDDFVLPCINALLPILGTLTSYLKSEYPYDSRDHTTSFFSVIYAPPGTGKGFVERFMDLLFEDITLRDYVQSERENVYLRAMNRKGQNEKSPDVPHTSLRIIPAKNSEAEFLEKQRDNHGYHMFTYAAEMDSWAKGVKAAGGNKDDMIRIAWDNGFYGQQFRSTSTFKGQVRLYWNVLITGTLQQVMSYFKNVENGLVTRCSFTSIDNQEFAAPPVWKNMTKRGLEVIKKFMERCDRRTYEKPCDLNIFDIESVNDDDFDKEIDWKFKFRERQEVDMSWIMPTINAFHKEQMEKAALDVDTARDVFRRRVGVRGFRLGIMCYGLWENPRPSDLEKCKAFIDWWMHKDLENMLKLWGAKYNEQAIGNPVAVQRTVYDALDANFTKNDVYTVCAKQGIKTPVRRILFDWSKLGYITKLDKEHYKKNGK